MYKYSNLVFTLFFLFIGFSSIYSQSERSICEIRNNPIHGEHVASVGTVTSVPSNDDFYISAGGCTIKCDGEEGNMPTAAMEVMVFGFVEIGDDGDELEIDVKQWTEITVNPPNPPTATVNTVQDAKNAATGTIAELTGNVIHWTDPDDGEGEFQDATGTIKIDFPDNNRPSGANTIVVLGTVEFEDNAKEIDVKYWRLTGGNPPSFPDKVAWTVSDANNLPDNTLAFIPGKVKIWTNPNDGEGTFEDAATDQVNIDFESDVIPLPAINDDIYVFGKLDTDNNTREIECHAWFLQATLGIDDFKVLENSLFPNPAGNYIQLKNSNDLSRFQIFNLMGKFCSESHIPQTGRINIESLQSGTYLINLFNAKGYTSSMIFQKQ